jgi:hypothetical protein
MSKALPLDQDACLLIEGVTDDVAHVVAGRDLDVLARVQAPNCTPHKLLEGRQGLVLLQDHTYTAAAYMYHRAHTTTQKAKEYMTNLTSGMWQQQRTALSEIMFSISHLMFMSS